MRSVWCAIVFLHIYPLPYTVQNKYSGDWGSLYTKNLMNLWNEQQQDREDR